MKSEFVFFDSNVYIHILRSPSYLVKVEPFLKGAYLYVLNKVVLMELWAGVKTKLEEHILQKHQQDIPLIGLSDDHFISAGKLMYKMRQGSPLEPKQRRRLTWDILIALSAAENHACLITENKEDFERIQKFLEFDFISVQ